MRYLLVIFLAFTAIPAFAQEPIIGDYIQPTNESLLIQKTEIPYSEFNRVSSDVLIKEFENMHSSSWQAELHNDLLYGCLLYTSDAADE